MITFRDFRKIGAGDEIRTHDPNLGKGAVGWTLTIHFQLFMII